MDGRQVVHPAVPHVHTPPGLTARDIMESGVVTMTLKEARTYAGLTQTQLAERAGVSQSLVGELESNKWRVNTTGAAIVARLAHVLDVDYIDLLAPGWDKGLKY